MKKTILVLIIWLWLLFGNTYGQNWQSLIKMQIFDYSCNKDEDCSVNQAVNNYSCCWWKYDICASSSKIKYTNNNMLHEDCSLTMCSSVKQDSKFIESCECKSNKCVAKWEYISNKRRSWSYYIKQKLIYWWIGILGILIIFGIYKLVKRKSEIDLKKSA